MLIFEHSIQKILEPSIMKTRVMFLLGSSLFLKDLQQ